jgi:hypothetical protein
VPDCGGVRSLCDEYSGRGGASKGVEGRLRKSDGSAIAAGVSAGVDVGESGDVVTIDWGEILRIRVGY